MRGVHGRPFCPVLSSGTGASSRYVRFNGMWHLLSTFSTCILVLAASDVQIPPRCADMSAAAPLCGASVDFTTPLCRVDPSRPEQAVVAKAMLAGGATEVPFFGPLLLRLGGIALPAAFDRPSFQLLPDLGFQLEASSGPGGQGGERDSDDEDGDVTGAAPSVSGPAQAGSVAPTRAGVSLPASGGPPSAAGAALSSSDAPVGNKRQRVVPVVDLTADD
jgi:hypothetical protein